MNNMLTLTKKNPVCVRVTQTGLYEVPNMNDFVSDHNLISIPQVYIYPSYGRSSDSSQLSRLPSVYTSGKNTIIIKGDLQQRVLFRILTGFPFHPERNNLFRNHYICKDKSFFYVLSFLPFI